jgi:hypothetical protein
MQCLTVSPNAFEALPSLCSFSPVPIVKFDPLPQLYKLLKPQTALLLPFFCRLTLLLPPCAAAPVAASAGPGLLSASRS